MKTKELTIEQAMEVLNHISVNKSLFEGNGSSRAVYHILYNGKEYVVKLAGDGQGRKQNEIERKLYEEQHASNFLAPIVWAYQDIMLICDYVEILDFELVEYAYNESFEDFVEWAITDFGYEEDDRERLCELQNNIVEVVSLLENFQGKSSDNYQIGYNTHDTGIGANKIVAYDYGYCTYLPREEQVGEVEYLLSFGESQSSIFDVVADWILGTETTFQIVYKYKGENEHTEYFDFRYEAYYEWRWHLQSHHLEYAYLNKIETNGDYEEITELESIVREK